MEEKKGMLRCETRRFREASAHYGCQPPAARPPSSRGVVLEFVSPDRLSVGSAEKITASHQGRKVSNDLVDVTGHSSRYWPITLLVHRWRSGILRYPTKWQFSNLTSFGSEKMEICIKDCQR